MNPIALKFDEAAAVLGLSERTLERQMAVGTGPMLCCKKPRLFRIKELERWAEEQQRKINGDRDIS